MGNETKKHLVQHSFSTCEVSPLVLARQDEEKLTSALQQCLNFKLTPQGGLQNDTGTIFINSTKYASTKARLIPFQFSNVQAYVLEIGNGYTRFYADEGQIINGTIPVELVTPYQSADLSDIQFAQSADYIYLTHPNYPPAYVSRTNNFSWSYAAIPFADGPYQDLNTNPANTITASASTGSVTLTANFNCWNAQNVGAFVRLEEAITSYYPTWTQGVCYPQNYVVQNAGNVYEVTNGGSTPTSQNYTLAEWINATSYPATYHCVWGQNAYVSVGAAVSGSTPPTHTSGSVSDGGVTWTFMGFVAGPRPPIHNTGTVSDGNLNWLFLNPGYGYAQITGYTSPTQVTATVIQAIPISALGGTQNFRLGAFDNYNGYPACICFYEQRLCLAATANFPESIWMSCSADYYNFQPTKQGSNVLDTNSIAITLASGKVNVIVWINPAVRLLIGTIGAEWQVWPANTQSGFSPSNIQAKQMSTNGSVANINIQQPGLSTLYLDRTSSRIYEATYNYLNDLYVSKDLNKYAEHIFRQRGGIIDSAYQACPWSIVWYLGADGTLVGLTYQQDEQIAGFHIHILKGSVESIAVIPSIDNRIDQLWMVVNRTVNGQTVRYVEIMQDPFYPNGPKDKAAMWYVECGSSFNNGNVVSTISGLGYLQGLSVVPIVDGGAQPTQVVPASGTITLQTPGTNVVIGLPYTSSLITMPIEFEGQTGSVQGQLKRTNVFWLRLLNSLGFSYGASTEVKSFLEDFTYTRVPFSTSGDTMGQSPDLFLGDWKVPLGGAMANSISGTISIQQTQPYPLNILSIMYDCTVSEQT